jgi:hypothetical protein
LRSTRRHPGLHSYSHAFSHADAYSHVDSDANTGAADIDAMHPQRGRGLPYTDAAVDPLN